MSKLFESLQKAELIGADEFPLTESRGGNGALRSVPAQVVVDTPQVALPEVQVEEPVVFPAAPAEPQRSVKLRVSALSPVFPFDAKNHAAAEQYRIIRTKVLHHPRQPKMLVVSSGGSGDGKTVTSVNLAASFALKPDVRVALIDADMRRPQIANLLGMDVAPGLGEVLAGSKTFAEAAAFVENIPNLCVLTAGSANQRPAELLDSPRWRSLLVFLRESFDYVVFDAPPISAVADYELVQLVCDGVVLVARPDHSDRKTHEKALQAVPKEKLLGLVLNCVDNWFLWRTHGYEYYSRA